MKRLCALPFVPREMLPMGLEIFDENVEDIGKDDIVYGFAKDLVDYVTRTWVNGKFSVQDWNLFDVGKLSAKHIYFTAI